MNQCQDEDERPNSPEFVCDCDCHLTGWASRDEETEYARCSPTGCHSSWCEDGEEDPYIDEDTSRGLSDVLEDDYSEESDAY